MHPVVKKLNYKNQEKVLSLNAPREFQDAFEELKNLSLVDQIIKETKYEFILIFVEKIQEIEEFSMRLPHIMEEDAVLWIAYPKKVRRNIHRISIEIMAGNL